MGLKDVIRLLVPCETVGLVWLMAVGTRQGLLICFPVSLRWGIKIRSVYHPYDLRGHGWRVCYNRGLTSVGGFKPVVMFKLVCGMISSDCGSKSL